MEEGQSNVARRSAVGFCIRHHPGLTSKRLAVLFTAYPFDRLRLPPSCASAAFRPGPVVRCSGK